LITPVLVLDSREKWKPRPVESVLEVKATLNGGPIDLAKLPKAGGRMDFPKNMKDVAGPVVGYHRVVNVAYLYWHQFWFWYLYNPKQYFGSGEHEGDWEFVQIATADAAGNQPVMVTASQHQTGGKREAWRCELANGRPVIYVARDSHANYFSPLDNVEDEANGTGERLTNIEWREFGPWAEWPGRWGNSTGAGKSPESPGSQDQRWRLPHLYHSSSR
jgi:hypothetical protein